MQETERTARTERIWQRFSTRLRSFLRSRLPDDSAADDVLQDVFVKVHGNLHKLRDDERMQPWLYQIARNAVADHFRARRLATLEEISTAADIATAEPLGEAEQKLADGLFAMIDELPPNYRAALFLTEVEGLTQAEMAERLGVSLSGGKSRVQRGRERLKQLLLECCHIDLDRHGAIVGYQKRCCCCAPVGPARPAQDKG